MAWNVKCFQRIYDYIEGYQASIVLSRQLAHELDITPEQVNNDFRHMKQLGMIEYEIKGKQRTVILLKREPDWTRIITPLAGEVLKG